MSVKEITAADFDDEVLAAKETVLVDFFATWCGPCKMMAPVIAEIADENQNAKVVKIDVDEAEDIAARYGIMSIPTMIIFKNGEPAKTFVGLTEKDKITAEL